MQVFVTANKHSHIESTRKYASLLKSSIEEQSLPRELSDVHMTSLCCNSCLLSYLACQQRWVVEHAYTFLTQTRRQNHLGDCSSTMSFERKACGWLASHVGWAVQRGAVEQGHTNLQQKEINAHDTQ